MVVGDTRARLRDACLAVQALASLARSHAARCAVAENAFADVGDELDGWAAWLRAAVEGNTAVTPAAVLEVLEAVALAAVEIAVELSPEVAERP